MKIKSEYIVLPVLFVGMLLFGFSVLNMGAKEHTVSVSAQSSKIDNTKIEWGIKREKDHKQPDLGTRNKELIDKYNGIAMGNENMKNIYLTFDEGYEAGYTPQILETLKNNNVTATFFLTAHFINTEPDLVKSMIEQGSIIR